MSDHRAGNRREGKVALISGAAREMGAGHARAVVAQGAASSRAASPLMKAPRSPPGWATPPSTSAKAHPSGAASRTLEGNRPWNT